MQKYTALICCINSKYIHSSLAPWCLLSGVKELCDDLVDAQVVEGTINEKMQAVVKRLLDKRPDAVGFCCYIWNIRYVLETANQIKTAMPNVKIILGGPEVSFNQRDILDENSFVDYVLAGEGDFAFARLVKSLAEGELPEKNTVSMRAEDRLVIGDYQTAQHTVSPYCKEYFDALGGRIAYIESSRGCPYHCAFCLSGTDRTVRFFELDRVKKEMLLLAQSGAKTIKFVDRTFNCSKKRASEILIFIKENYGSAIADDVCFHFEIAADILDDELLLLISSMPCGSVQFEAGIQSFNSKTLEAINRKTNLDRLCRNIKKLVSFGNCHIHIDLIAGLPHEDLASFKQSFNLAFELGANMLQLGFLKILYGSCMETNKENFPCEYSTEPPYEVISTPWISKQELDFLHLFEDAFERVYNSGRFRRTVKYLQTCTKKTAFDIFSDFAICVKDKNIERPPLDLYTKWIYEFFSCYENVDKMVLRDMMITDRIAGNSSGIIPKCLQVKDENLRKVKHALALKYPMKKGTKRSAAILYSTNEVIFCDYGEKGRVSGEYEFAIEKMEDLTNFFEENQKNA
ncbi:MAG: B12-binding domain-containing radical SAM protein [Faecalibacterium sp.]|nr:B12-binding domain-containing radical SAM protein [Ruminococcus sp.]MCM1391969.1 B12-binding domain-containing radical SAM protein [Ruminococcus sp.]MCM1485072.1 B12-binding domain-containing radical SAM protein [Faecalibacterium sp.]